MKPKPAPGMGTQWKVDEEEIIAAARLQFQLTDLEFAYNRRALWARLFTAGMLVGLVVRLAADAVYLPHANFIQTVVFVATATTWLVLDWRARQVKAGRLSHTIAGTESIKYVPPEADEKAAE